MSIDEFMDYPGLRGEGRESAQQIRQWLAAIEGIGQFKHLEASIRACDVLWQHPHHQHFTTHGLLHSGRIVARLADWLAANRADALEPMEAFLLIGAAYLHDVGMQCVCPTFLQAEGIATNGQQIAAQDYGLLEGIRQKHPVLSDRMIRDACAATAVRAYREFPLDARAFAHEAELMAVISRHHCGPISAVPANYRTDAPCHEVSPPVRLLLLIHLLRIGDALDADARRLPENFLTLHPWNELPPKEQFHTLKHFCTASIQRHGIGFFVFHYTFPSDAANIKTALQQASEKFMREHVRDASRLLSGNGISLTAVESVVEKEDANCPYSVTDGVRAECRATLAAVAAAAPRLDPTRSLVWLSEHTSHIDIRGLAVGSDKAHNFPIEELYIPLTTTTALEQKPKRGRKPKRVKAEQAAHPELQQALKAHRLVIVGDPGAGKSTFVNRITAALCEAWLGRDPAAAKKRVGLEDRLLPVLIRVAQLAEHIQASRQRNDGPTLGPTAPSWLAHFLEKFGADKGWGLDGDYFRKHFEDGTALVMLDGLDEAPSRVVREQISKLVQEAAQAYPRCRFVVTSRPAAYVEKAVLPGFAHAQIEPLTDPAIETFLHKWSGSLFHGQTDRAKAHCDGLLAALRSKPEIRRLARNPLMLTALAVVHWNEKRIPEQRVDLYESILKWLARSREHKPGRPSDERALTLLQVLALAMQDVRGKRQVQVARRWAAERIAPQWRDRKAAERVAAAEMFLTEEELDSGIVVKRGNAIRFWHLTFQEYLAARALAALSEANQQKLLLTQPGRLHSPDWWETVLLFGGVLHRQGPEKADGMFTAILDQLGKKASLADQARCAGLLGAIMRDLTAVKFAPEDPRYTKLLDRVMAIFDPLKSRKVPMRHAIAAGEALGRAGDSRFEPAARRQNWVPIPACEYRIQETKRTVKLDAYRIGRYPVTVLEYAEFVEAEDYADPQWWTAGGLGKWETPDEWEEQFAHPNRPVVGVSWFEAAAYAKWRRVRLPTDGEWERAAAGLEGREYPWGNTKPNERLANYDMKVGRPTPVGVYPCGATPDGIYDMAGNVWEWCADWHDKDQDARVVRGGSWYNHPGLCRSAFRYRTRPVNRINNLGFRVGLDFS